MIKYDVDQIVEKAINNDLRPYNKFVDNLYKEFYPKLIHLTKSKNHANEVYSLAMEKFWERFIAKQETLPLKPINYIYIMCKNAWIAEVSNHWNAKKTSLSSEISEKEKTIENLFEDDSEDNFLIQKSLTLGLEKLSPKCKCLIEHQLNSDKSVAELQNELNLNSYQAVVQAKYNCKKKLIKLVYNIFQSLKEEK